MRQAAPIGRRHRRASVAFLVALAAVLTGCSSAGSKAGTGSGTAAAAGAGVKIRFAVVANLAYLPIYEMVDDGNLAKFLTGARASYVSVSNSTDAAAGILSGRLDATVVGTPQFLTSWSKGIPWKVLSGSSTSEVKAITNDPDIKSIADIKSSELISYPGPASIQQIVMSLGAQQQLGDAKKFSKQFQPLVEPDASNALMSHQISVDVAQSPFSDKLLTMAGYHTILDSYDVLGRATLAVLAVSDKFGNAAERKGLYEAYSAALASIQSNPQHAADVAFNHHIGISSAADLVSVKANTYSPQLTSIDTIATFLKDNSYISKEPAQSQYADPLAVAAGK